MQMSQRVLRSSRGACAYAIRAKRRSFSGRRSMSPKKRRTMGVQRSGNCGNYTQVQTVISGSSWEAVF